MSDRSLHLKSASSLPSQFLSYAGFLTSSAGASSTCTPSPASIAAANVIRAKFDSDYESAPEIPDGEAHLAR